MGREPFTLAVVGPVDFQKVHVLVHWLMHVVVVHIQSPEKADASSKPGLCDRHKLYLVVWLRGAARAALTYFSCSRAQRTTLVLFG